MATRSRTTFKKRQKELARMEKQRDKLARKAARKQAAAEGHPIGESPMGEFEFPPDEDALDGTSVEGEGDGEGEGDDAEPGAEDSK